MTDAGEDVTLDMLHEFELPPDQERQQRLDAARAARASGTLDDEQVVRWYGFSLTELEHGQ